MKKTLTAAALVFIFGIGVGKFIDFTFFTFSESAEVRVIDTLVHLPSNGLMCPGTVEYGVTPEADGNIYLRLRIPPQQEPECEKCPVFIFGIAGGRDVRLRVGEVLLRKGSRSLQDYTLVVPLKFLQDNDLPYYWKVEVEGASAVWEFELLEPGERSEGPC